MECQFCNKVYPDRDSFDMHRLEDCSEIQIEAIIKWERSGDIDCSSCTSVYVLLSHMRDKVELTQMGESDTYQSEVILTLIGTYEGQIIIKNGIYPVKPVRLVHFDTSKEFSMINIDNKQSMDDSTTGSKSELCLSLIHI